MEEVPDDDRKNNGRTIPEGVPALLMTDEEFNTLQQGEKRAPKPKNVQHLRQHLKNQEKVKLKYVEPDVRECQPRLR